jgi:type IV pilus assembly protein PilB
MERKRLGDLLLEMGIITEEQLQHVLQIQKETKERLGELLIREGIVTEEQLIEVLEFQLGIPHINLYKYQIDSSIVQLIPEPLARRYLALAVRKNKNKLTVAMADPLDFYAIEDLSMSTGFVIETAIASKEELRAFIDRFYGLKESVDELRALVPREEELESQVTSDDSPVVRLVNQLIHQAVQQRASDIHIDPSQNTVHIRFRIDGVMRTEQVLPISMQPMIAARIKIMANLNIAERRLPQDGRMNVDVDFRQIDIRVSTLPTVHGEKCVMRLLDKKNAVLDIERLGMTEDNLNLFKSMIRSPYGIVLITGPTGSGKTSTLYAALRELTDEQHNIITVEDPVEYQLEGINQVQVNPNTGLTFARGLRAILRQDPDIIMVGEIRDFETAEIAVRSALTGHLVLSTLHTNDAVSSITRLIDMGVEPFLVASSTIGVVAQRLVRKICLNCKESYRPTVPEEKWLAERGYVGVQLYRGRGCASCGKSGYQGRMAIHEVLKLDDDIRALIMEKKPDSEYRKYVADKGMMTMQQDGLLKVMDGLTTLQEVIRSTMRD